MGINSLQTTSLSLIKALVGFSLLVLSVTCSSERMASTELSNVNNLLKELKLEIETLREARHQDQILIKTLEQRLDQLDKTTVSSVTAITSTSESPIITPFYFQVPKRSEPHDNERPNYRHYHRLQVSHKHETIRSLEKERTNLGKLESQLKQLQRDLTEMVAVKEKEVGVTEEEGDLRLETELLRTEIYRIQQSLDSLRTDKEKVSETSLRANQVTNKWLTKTVEQLQTEFRELARTLNVSAALNRCHTFESNVALLKSDFGALQKEVEALQALHLKDAASVDQLQAEVKDLRSLSQTLSVRYQHISEEVTSLKDELAIQATNHNQAATQISSTQENMLRKKKKREIRLKDNRLFTEEENHLKIYNKSGKSHRSRHQKHMQVEITMIQRAMEAIENKQAKAQRDIQWIKQNFTTLRSIVNDVSNNTNFLETQATNLESQQFVLAKQMEESKGISQDIVQEIRYTKNRLRNISQTTMVINKLHSSSLELFKALEVMEDRFDKSIRDLQKEVSKSDFNLAQMQSSLEILRGDQNDHYETLKILKKNYSVLKIEVQRDHFKLLSVQNEIINRTLQECKVSNVELIKEIKLENIDHKVRKLQTQINNNQIKVDNLYNQFKTKDENIFTSTWEKHREEVEKEIQNISTTIPQLQSYFSDLKHEISKFVNVLPQDCSMKQITMLPVEYKSGVYLIHPKTIESAVPAYCDMVTDGGYWTVIQRRENGSEDFYRPWEDYKHGFGEILGEHWLGNEVIHHLTSTDNYTLRVDMWDTFGQYKFAEYDLVYVGSESDNYRLTIGGYLGNASNAMKDHNEMPFSTKDRDNDASSTHCARHYSSGWWYNHCQYVNINGRYDTGLTWFDTGHHEWMQLRKVEMKLRPSNLKVIQKNN
ncbi:uncharacterized protein LOC143251963 [Tachypleus tridentatus]|uniref:uncharacterized protein LOC143251963 n=1 Tax=Tachypleus tridentatus TaxID=6853 RepID=UPI003FD5935B